MTATDILQQVIEIWLAT